MALNYRPVDRDQQFLLPPDMREWLPADHLVWVVEALVADMDTTPFTARKRRLTTSSRAGQRGYDPDMLLVLLLYAYSVGQRSSRGIEKLCHTDVAFRVACGGDIPDHTVISRFRSDHAGDFSDLFTQVLGECIKAGMGRVGVIAIDGTKIAADASMGSNRREEYIRDLIDEITAEAAEADVVEDELDIDDDDDQAARTALIAAKEARSHQRKADRLGRARECADSIDQAPPSHTDRAIEKSEEVLAKKEAVYQAAYEKRLARYHAWRAAPVHSRGKRAVMHPEEYPRLNVKKDVIDRSRQAIEAKKAKLAAAVVSQAKTRNLTDPESRLMKTQFGFVQGYNLQFSVSDDHVILAAETFANAIDVRLFEPMLTATVREYEAACGIEPDIGLALADAGYHSTENLECPGPDRLLPDRQSRKLSKVDAVAEVSKSEPIQAMRERMADPENLELYKRRGALVEAVNGWVKERRGLRRFSMRGLEKVAGEAKLMAAVVNIGRLNAVRGFAATI